MLKPKTHEYFMQQALKLAQQAKEEGEIPIGAVVVSGEKIIGKGYNQVEKLGDATAHAEMIAITAASDYLNSKYLKNTTLYVTVEPCVMCGGALKWAQIDKVVYGADEENFGFWSKAVSGLPKKVEVVSGILKEDSKALILNFFKELRAD